MTDDPVQEGINIGYLLAFAAIAYVAYLVYQSFNPSSPADNGKPKCSSYSDPNCTSGSGGPCGLWEYLTATSCYQGSTPAVTPTPATTQATTDSQPSTIGSWLFP